MVSNTIPNRSDSELNGNLIQYTHFLKGQTISFMRFRTRENEPGNLPERFSRNFVNFGFLLNDRKTDVNEFFALVATVLVIRHVNKLMKISYC